VVHHKSLASAIRTEDRVTRVLYPVLKNKLYFSLRNNRGHYPVQRAIDDMIAFVQLHETGLRHHIEAQRISGSELDAFGRDVDRAWSVGLERGLTGQRSLLQPAFLERHAAGFIEFRRPSPAGGPDVFVFISREYPPNRMGGIGRYVHQLARSIAQLGHKVHVLTVGEDHDRIDFEESVWVHRIVARSVPRIPPVHVPQHIWNHASTMLDALHDIARRQSVTAVYAPIWDCEGAAILFDGEFPLVVGLQTTLRFWLDSHRHIGNDAEFHNGFAEPMLALEAQLMRECDGVHSISRAIVEDIAREYDIALDPPRTQIIPLGLADWTVLPATAPVELPEGNLRLLFVGRLESRKGIDVLLGILPRLLARHPQVHADIVGNDTIPGPEGIPYRVGFEATASDAWSSRVRFHGEVAEDRLRGFYRACDILVAPSRFESFGLILVEAMMFGKPVVACRVGGMVEVGEEGQTALFAEPGDAKSLEECLERLINDPGLCQMLGSAGRQRYEARFTPAAMADDVVALLRRARAHRKAPAVAMQS
jgi:glycosyltransferase involved in cell wall biosynthesis